MLSNKWATVYRLQSTGYTHMTEVSKKIKITKRCKSCIALTGSHLKISVIGHILILFRHQHVDYWVSAFPDHNTAFLLQNLWPAQSTFRQPHYTQCNEEGNTPVT